MLPALQQENTKDNILIIIKEQKQVLTKSAAGGKILFMAKCASCHNLFKNATGPGLFGFEERSSWNFRQNVYDWIRNPSAFMAKNEYAGKLKEIYDGTMMTAFPDLTNEEIDAICDYINQTEKIRYNTTVGERQFTSPPASPPAFCKIHFEQAVVHDFPFPQSFLFAILLFHPHGGWWRGGEQ